jgi:hypothetical protein
VIQDAIDYYKERKAQEKTRQMNAMMNGAGIEASPTLSLQEADKILYGTPPIEPKADKEADTVTPVTVEKPKPRDPIFDWLVVNAWGIALKNFDRLEGDAKDTAGARIGKTKKALVGIHKSFKTELTLDHLELFKAWYSSKKIAIPRDDKKWSEHYLQFYSEKQAEQERKKNKAQSDVNPYRSKPKAWEVS